MFRTFAHVSARLVIITVICILSAALIAPVLPSEGELVYRLNSPVGLFLYDVRHRLSYPLIRDNTVWNPRWSADGQRLTVDNPDLGAPAPGYQLIGMDFRSYTFSGMLPAEEVPHVSFMPGVKFSADNESLAYVRLRENFYEVVWADETGNERLQHRFNGVFTWTPGNHLRLGVFEMTESQYRVTVSDLHADASVDRLFTRLYANRWVTLPTFSPDAAYLLIWHWAENSDRFELRALDTTSGGVTVIDDGIGWQDGATAWSPDSTRIAYTIYDVNYHPQIFVRTLNSSTPPQLVYALKVADRIDEIAWSADGTRLAFVVGGLPNVRVCILNLADPPADCPIQVNAQLSQLAWRPR